MGAHARNSPPRTRADTPTAWRWISGAADLGHGVQFYLLSRDETLALLALRHPPISVFVPGEYPHRLAIRAGLSVGSHEERG
jgi:hypothetical protein